VFAPLCTLALCAYGLQAGSAAAASIRLDLASELAARQSLVVTKVGQLADGGRQAFQFELAEPEALDLRIPFDAAPFNGTQLNVRVNRRRLLPYFAFGSDTRYESVRGRPGMRPPLATIEGRWLIPPALLREGKNELVLWTTGAKHDEALQRLGPAPTISIRSFTLAPADGHTAPTFANTIYYDFNIWPQGYAWPDMTAHRRFLALMGVINGKGMPCVVPPVGKAGQPLWGVKRQCESNALDWGVGHQEFYTIWEFCGQPELWAKYVDVDGNPDTRSDIHGQTVSRNVLDRDPAAKGADVVLFDAEKYAKSLEPAIRALAPYADFYNFKCEQRGVLGAGFGVAGDRWDKHGLSGDDWASNYRTANKAARDLVMKYDPDDGRVQEMNFWMPTLRHYLYDGALRHNQPMSGVVDILMTHFARLTFYDYTEDGRLTADVFHPELQYPGGQFDTPRRRYRGHWHGLAHVGYPEHAIDFNRYRLGRTENDVVHGDPKLNRWADGRPFDYRAGLDGDELMYNSENGIWAGYSATAPYQYLHGNFAYSLLPTGASEPRELKVTTRVSPTETKDLPVNLYGEWVDGVGHTKRLRTVDPLYGDLFGWTGQEYCNSGDYITMTGVREPHHRHQPSDASALVRRICYAFVTTGTVVPAYLNRGHDDSLFVKCVTQVFDGEPYIGLYAANFDNRTQRLDATLPIAFPKGTEAIVFDDRAWDWARSARPLRLRGRRELRYKADVPPLGAWLVLIRAKEDVVAAALGLPAAPVPRAPVADAAVSDEEPVLRWRAGGRRAARYVVEVAREARFRPQDRVLVSAPLGARAYRVKQALQAEWRYFWRVRAIDADGRSGPWSRPTAFVYQWPAYAEVYSPKEPSMRVSPPARAEKPTVVPPEWQRLATEHRLETAKNLAWQGEIFGTGGYMRSPSRAVDGQAFSYWTNDVRGNTYQLPAQWCVIWPRPMKMRRVRVLWRETRIPRSFAIQVSDDAKTWRDLFKSDGGADVLTDLRVRARAMFFRLYITQAAVESNEVGVRELVIE